jgi:hypothetical protein
MSDEARRSGAGNDNGDGAGLDQELRDRVSESVGRLIGSLDAAAGDPTADNLDRLREDADRAMRAIGRVILETERVVKERG